MRLFAGKKAGGGGGGRAGAGAVAGAGCFLLALSRFQSFRLFLFAGHVKRCFLQLVIEGGGALFSRDPYRLNVYV